MERIFVDTDVVLDLLAMRIPFYNAAAEVFSLADKAELSVFVSALTFANVHYILSRSLSQAESRQMLSRLKTMVNILPVDGKIIDLALSSGFEDFEDGIQYYTAIEKGIVILLTRNLIDYKKAEITVMSPDQYLNSRVS